MLERERCPKCRSLDTVRVDPEQNLYRCTECGTWFDPGGETFNPKILEG